MGLFGKRNEIVDLTETIIPQRRRLEKTSQETSIPIQSKISYEEKSPTSAISKISNSVLDFVSGEPNKITQEQEQPEKNLELPDIQIMLKNANQRLQDQSNEIYKLLHRIELLEKKIERIEGRRL